MPKSKINPPTGEQLSKTNASQLKSNSASEPQTMDELLASTGYKLRGFKRGDTIEGTVVSLNLKEILIDVGYKSLGVVSEREMDMVKDLLKNLKVGDRIPVQIVSPESEAGQIILSIRRAGMEKRWQEALEKKEKGETIEVTGLEVTRGGLLADWQGLRGFIPLSQLDPNRGGASAGVGKKLKIAVLDVDKSTNRLVFSEKKVTAPKDTAEKKEALSKINIGQVYEGKVSGLVPFGIFVSLDNIEGLVHISEIAWEKVTNPNDYFKIGDKIKVLVISKEEVSGRLNLSIKQLQTDPWQELVKKYSLEQTVEGKASKTSSYGVFVELEKGVEGLIHISKIPPGVELTEGERVTCTIEGIDFQKRKISLGLVLKGKPVGYR